MNLSDIIFQSLISWFSTKTLQQDPPWHYVDDVIETNDKQKIFTAHLKYTSMNNRENYEWNIENHSLIFSLTTVNQDVTYTKNICPSCYNSLFKTDVISPLSWHSQTSSWPEMSHGFVGRERGRLYHTAINITSKYGEKWGAFGAMHLS